MTRAFRILLLIACLALPGGLLACGAEEEKEQTAAEILRGTVRSGGAGIDNGRLALRFQLDPEGLLAIGGPVKFTLDGPFAASRSGELTRFRTDFVATLAHRPYRGSVLSTGRRALVALDDGTYEVDRATVDRLRRSSRSRKGPAGLPVTGFAPQRWITAPRRKGEARIDGVDTIRVGGRLNVARLLADLDGLLTKAGGSSSGSTLLTPKLRRQIAATVESSTVDVWTGKADGLLRRLAVRIVFFFKDDSSPLQVLRGGTINLSLRLAGVNATAAPARTFAAPRTRARPLADLTGGSPANILEGIAAGITGGRGRELFACLTAADGSSSSLVRCVSKLAP